MKANRSVLECPECKKPLVGIGSKLERIHPVARFVKERYVGIVLGWFLMMPGVIWLTNLLIGGNNGALAMGPGLFSLMLVPFVVNYFLLRAFAVYRITDCPYCGFHEEQKLGLSDSGEY